MIISPKNFTSYRFNKSYFNNATAYKFIDDLVKVNI